MKRKISAKLSLNRETLHQLESGGLRGVAGGSGQIGCDNTLGLSCRNPCGPGTFTQDTCRPSCTPPCTITINPTTTTNPPTETA